MPGVAEKLTLKPAKAVRLDAGIEAPAEFFPNPAVMTLVFPAFPEHMLEEDVAEVSCSQELRSKVPAPPVPVIAALSHPVELAGPALHPHQLFVAFTFPCDEPTPIAPVTPFPEEFPVSRL